jgi:transposase InsO family protein
MAGPLLSAWEFRLREFLEQFRLLFGGQTDRDFARFRELAGIAQRGPWRSFEAVEFATLEWVDWFNNRRLLEPIGNIPPAEAEERYYAILEKPAMAA